MCRLLPKNNIAIGFLVSGGIMSGPICQEKTCQPMLSETSKLLAFIVAILKAFTKQSAATFDEK